MDVVAVRRATGGRNDLLDRLRRDPLFASVESRIGEVADPAGHVGRAAQQVETFFREEVEPALKASGVQAHGKSWNVSV